MLPRLSILLMIAAFALPAVPLAAQEMHFSGKVENGSGVCYYCPGFDYVLDYTHTSLSSPSIDLAPYVGAYVTGTGTWNGSATAPVIVVSAIELAPQGFSIGGNASPGNKINFTVFGTPGEAAVVAVAFKDGFFPVNAFGAAFLSPLTLFVLGQGVIGGSGSMAIKVELPNNPALLGLNIFGQAAVVHTDGTQSLTNSDRKVIG